MEGCHHGSDFSSRGRGFYGSPFSMLSAENKMSKPGYFRTCRIPQHQYRENNAFKLM